MSALLVILNASALCVAHTDVCAPPGSTLDGTVTHNGGQVTVTPSKTLRALGADFKAGTKVVVSVQPWRSSNNTAGAIVHVAGELTREMVVSGARVAGMVRIGQSQGQKSAPQLVEANDLKSGQLKVGAAGTVDVHAGMKIIGHVDIDRVRLDITSTQNIRALGLDLTAGTVRVETSPTTTTIAGTLVRPQEVGGALVEQQVYATIEAGTPRFGSATLAATTQLRKLGLPDGEAPRGTIVRATPGGAQLVGKGPFTICGLTLASPATLGNPAVVFTRAGPPAVFTVNGQLARRDVDVGGGLHMTGAVTLRYGATGCQLTGVDGVLSRNAKYRGVTFAAKTTFGSAAIGTGTDQLAVGTLAQPATVDGLHVKGKVSIQATSAGALKLLDGTLAKPATFEQWKLPAGTHVERGDATWAFTLPGKQSARTTGIYRGERIDAVASARSYGGWTHFEVRRPHTPTGTKLALRTIAIEHQTGCVSGDVAAAQQIGILKIPKAGHATTCGSSITTVRGGHAFPTLQVGPWFATHAVVGDPSTPPSSKTTVRPPSSTAGTRPGFWIQINSLCQGPHGIPVPPPPERWIWVDDKGQAPDAADAKELARGAAAKGTPCPVVKCCAP